MALIDAIEPLVAYWDREIESLRNRIRKCQAAEEGADREARTGGREMVYFSSLFGGRILLDYTLNVRIGQRDRRGRRLPLSIPVA